MTPEAQRIEIAKACGWLTHGATFMWVPFPDVHDHCTARDTDPLSDLNAMHEAEKALTEEQKKIYTAGLHPKELHHYLMADFFVCHATAAQRAEAFLRTLNLWKN